MEQKQEQWKEIIEAQRRSVMSAAEYCRRDGIRGKRFFYQRSLFRSESRYTVLKTVRALRKRNIKTLQFYGVSTFCCL